MKITRDFLSIWLWLYAVALPASAALPADFTKWLNESGLAFQSPPGYVSTTIRNTPLLPYEYALKKKDGSVEIRYALRPIARMSIDYQDPHNSAPEPNHVFTMMFTALIGELSRGGASPHREFSQEEAGQKFNADWAALSLFDLEPAYSSDYRQAFLLAIHKNNLSDAYLVVLFNDIEMIKPELARAMESLQYR